MAKTLRQKIKWNNRKMDRIDKVGTDGVNAQDTRARAAGDSPKALTRQAIKRVGEYKKGKVEKDTIARGMGAATSGGKFRKDG
jgi:hypothetical protein